MFADSVNNLCVKQCSAASATFADYLTGACVPVCPFTYFADSRDRVCQQNCSYLYADSTVNPPACVATCPTGTFAD